MKQVLCIILAILLLLCLTHMPYGYYVLVRYASMIMFGFLAYYYIMDKKMGLGLIFVALSILFQPFFKFALGRIMWNVVDVIVAVGLIYLVLKSSKKE